MISKKPIYRHLVRVLFSYKGRINRKTYWLCFFGSFGILFLCGIPRIVFPEQYTPFTSLLILLIYPLIYSQIPIHVKRLHDINLSGWWVLIFMIPFIGILLSFIICGCTPGTKGINRYGYPPKLNLKENIMNRDMQALDLVTRANQQLFARKIS